MADDPFFTTPAALAGLLGGPSWPAVVDLRLEDDYAAATRDLPAAIHRAEADFAVWSAALDPARPVVVSCQRGLKVSQAAVARLRASGRRASSLAGGIVGWREAGLPLLDRAGLGALGWREGAPWVTRRRPKIDRAACPWLVSRFVDPQAVFLYVDPDQVEAVAARTGGIPYDIPGVQASHHGEDCSFDTILKAAGLADWPPLDRLAAIVRGADDARFDLAPQAAGLLAVSLGLSDLAGDDDHAMLRHAFVIYDGLYAWAARAADETHNWPPARPAER
jgi:rhodanese-related sulfurtransferase